MTTPIRIKLVTDIEGVAGILDFDHWCIPEGYRNECGCRFLTEEVNAAIAGFFEGGATEVVVLDGHGSGGSIRGELLDSRAMLQRGTGPAWPYTGGDYSALAFVGQHPKSCTPQGHLSHTQMFDCIDFRLNGLSLGEYGQLAFAAAEEGIPTIFVSGCEAMRREAEALTPGTVAVAVKYGLNPPAPPEATSEAAKNSQLDAVHCSPKEACRRIREGARRAVRRLLDLGKAGFPLPTLAAPYHAGAEYRENGPRTIPMFGKLPRRRIRTRAHDTIAGALREFYREIEWTLPDGDRVPPLE